MPSISCSSHRKKVPAEESLCEIAIKNSKPPEAESTYKETRNERAKLSVFAARVNRRGGRRSKFV
jgi:hypothetical protein